MQRRRLVFGIGLALLAVSTVVFGVMITTLARHYTFYRLTEARVIGAESTVAAGRNGKPFYVVTLRFQHSVDGKPIVTPAQFVARDAGQQQYWLNTYKPGSVQKIAMSRSDPRFVVLPDMDKVPQEFRNTMGFSALFLVLALGVVYTSQKRSM